MVWRSLRRLGVPLASIDDATQDVFLVVQRRLPEFEARSSIKTWIFGIALHVARYYRRRAIRTLHEEPDLSIVDESARDPSQHAEEHEAMRLVYSALEQLSEAHREVFVLADIEELTAPEIARMLKIPENTVYSRLRHARSNFEATLTKIAEGPRRKR